MPACGVLGALTVGGAPLSSARQRRLLAALLIAQGEVVSGDRLADIVWGGAPPVTANALQTYVSRLRSLLGAGSILRRAPGYALAAPVFDVDAWRFEELVDEARDRPAAEALGVLGEALGVWRGPAYAEFADDDFARAEAVRLEELRVAAAVARLDALLNVGRSEEAAADAVGLIEIDPYRESVWQRRIRALDASGRTVEAIRVYHEYRDLLADETGLVPSAELAALERALVASQPPTTATEFPDVLPMPLTTLIGRDVVRDELVELVTDRRVVTLVGPAGVGKTRLAVEVARAHRDRGGSRVAFVELASVEADGVIAAVTRTLDVGEGNEPIGNLRRAMADGRVLLVVDNCEHVIEMVAELVEALVPFCSGLRVLATSRTRLRLAGERVWAVPPLSVPDPDEIEGLADLDGYAATQLFLERAATTGHGIDAQTTSARAVARICNAVDGLPLGIELAAARTGELPLERIGAGLTSGDGSPIPSRAALRHRSLDAAIDWSYQLLAIPAQQVLRCLAVFEGGWTLEAAEAVCASEPVEATAVAAWLADLVAASLVRFEPATGRYAMLETVRAFAQARLVEAKEFGPVHDAHLGWCRRLAESCAPRIVGRVAADHVAVLDAEHRNLVAGLKWALANEHVDAATALSVDLLAFWYMVNPGREITDLVDGILDRPGPPTVQRLELTAGAGHLADHLGDFPGAVRRYQQALDLARLLDDPRVLGDCLVHAASVSDPDSGSGLLAEAQSIAARLDDAHLAAQATAMLGVLAARAGRYDDAVTCFEAAAHAATDAETLATARYWLAGIHAARGQWREARDLTLMVEQNAAEDGDRLWAATMCLQLVLIELAAGDLDRARLSYERARAWGRSTDDYPVDQLVFDAVGALIRAESGDVAAAAATARRLAELDAIGGFGPACTGWLVAGEVLARAGELTGARRCFGRVLRHRAGTSPENRANALEAIAGTLAEFDQRPTAITLAAAARSLRSRHRLVTPPWLTVAGVGSQLLTAGAATEPQGETEHEAVVLALTLDGP